MKKVLLFISLVLFSLEAMCQVVFPKFKIDQSGLDVKFMITANQGLKAIKVEYYIVNAVGKIVYCLSSEFNTDGVEIVKPQEAEFTGKYKLGKSYRRGYYIPNFSRLDVRPFPCRLHFMYMGSDDWVSIPITKENISDFFPTSRWAEIDKTMETFRKMY